MTMDIAVAAREIAAGMLQPKAAEVDRKRKYPKEGLNALGKAGLMGILVPEASGGLGGTLADLALACEALGWGCASTAMCFLMHACGTAVIAAKATPEQAKSWLSPAAKGKSIATLAFSERGTGAHFYAPELSAATKNGAFVLSGRKSFVTSGGHATLYPVLVNASGEPGLDVIVVTPDLGGVGFEGTWDGIGMAGNSSIVMTLEDVMVPRGNIVGAEGDGQSLVFDVVAPTFLIGLAGVNIGIAQAAFDTVVDHAKNRRYPSGQALAEIQAIQMSLADGSIAIEGARRLLQEAARAAAAGEEAALPLVMQAKIAATECAAQVTERAMRIGGGQAYGRGLPLERHWRDSRAGAVMAPTNDVLREWLGKIYTGLPLF